MGGRIDHSGWGYVSSPKGGETYFRSLLAADHRLVPSKQLKDLRTTAGVADGLMAQEANEQGADTL